MNSHIAKYYKESHGDESSPGCYHKVIILHEAREWEWEALEEMVPSLCRGWYELCQLDVDDRIEFTKDFWVSQLPYQPRLGPFLDKFFSQLEDIGVFITQKAYDEPFECQMVYCLKEGEGFFKGGEPGNSDHFVKLFEAFPEVIFPQDYLGFLSIHNGFSKVDDSGILTMDRIEICTAQLREILEEKEPLVLPNQRVVDPKQLIPFYQSFGKRSYQCFWDDWYPDQEMGNVYYSSATNTLSDIKNLREAETLSFKTFLGWLMFYMEKVA